MVWTLFWDMHGGGSTKVPPFDKIYIEAIKREATSVFYGRFGFDPNRTSCSCCGPDYSISEYNSFKKASSYQRNDVDSDWPSFGKIQSVYIYKKRDDVKVIPAKEIVDTERSYVIPESGWVWKD